MWLLACVFAVVHDLFRRRVGTSLGRHGWPWVRQSVGASLSASCTSVSVFMF